MSSGPSARKLKPRAGSSTCGEDTPRSSNTPDTFDAARRKRAAHRGKAVMHDREARIGHRLRRLDRSRILVERDQPPGRPEPREHRAAVTAAPERAVDVDAVRTRHERFDRFVQQHRPMLQFVSHRGRLRHRNQNVKFFSASGMPCAIAACSFAM